MGFSEPSVSDSQSQGVLNWADVFHTYWAILLAPRGIFMMDFPVERIASKEANPIGNSRINTEREKN